MYHPLYNLQWHKVHLVLKNTRNVCGREHPLSIFEGILKSTLNLCPKTTNIEYLFHVKAQSLEPRIRKNRVYPLEIIFTKGTAAEIETFLENLQKHLEDPYNNFKILSIGKPEVRSLEVLEEEETSLDSDCTEICLEFYTPFPFSPRIKNKRWLLDKDQFVTILCRRLKKLCDIDDGKISQPWRNVTLLPYYWNYMEFKHKPKSNRGKNEYINGAAGPLFLKGQIESVYPPLLLCSELHLSGRKLSKGRGYYVLQKNRKYFDEMLEDISCYRTVLNDFETENTLENSLSEGLIDSEKLIERIYQRVISGKYNSAPWKAIKIKKKKGGYRVIAIGEAEDQLIHRLLYSILYPTIDKMLENSAIGYRRGKSTKDARNMILEACRDGYEFVVESDIASFFDQIDWNILFQKLRDSIPEADTITIELLRECIKAPIEIKGKIVKRNRGLIQGSPLSPLLSNLYLDSFDEEIERQGFRLIRYGDDFLVLTRSEKEASRALNATKRILGELNLSIKEEKTRIRKINLGFSFLGMEFGTELTEDFIEQTSLKKPLFVRKNYTFVGIDANSVIIKENGKLIDRFPIKRIGEVIIFGNNVVSTWFLQKCSREKIPVSFCTRGGFYVNTLRPDSKRHFEISAMHAKRFREMPQEEKIVVAQKLVISKISNYLPWLTTTSGGAAAEARRQLQLRIENVLSAHSIEQILGYEGEASKVIFRLVNSRVKNPGFASKGRIPRKKIDRYNSLLDFSYSLLFSRINVLMRNRGLNPYLGFLHSHKDSYESLVTDLQEPFRARMDRLVVKVINLKIIKEEDFVYHRSRGYRLTHEAGKRFIESFERELSVRLMSDGGTFRQLLVGQLQILLNWVQKRGELFFYQVSQ